MTERSLDSFQLINRVFNEMKIVIQRPTHNGEDFSGELGEIQDAQRSFFVRILSHNLLLGVMMGTS